MEIMKILLKAFMIPFLIVSVFVIFIISIIFYDSVKNNISLSKFEKQLINYPLPPNTEFFETQSILGKLNGNGNGMDFFTSILIKSSLTAEELKYHYEKVKFEGAKKNSINPVAIDVIPVTGKTLKSKYLERTQLKFNILTELDNYSDYYFITLYNGGYIADFDLRGN